MDTTTASPTDWYGYRFAVLTAIDCTTAGERHTTGHDDINCPAIEGTEVLTREESLNALNERMEFFDGECRFAMPWPCRCVEVRTSAFRPMPLPAETTKPSGTGTGSSTPIDPRHDEALVYARSYTGTFGFMVEMKAKAVKVGARLSPKMVDAILRCKARDAAWTAERTTKATTTQPVPEVAPGRYAVDTDAGHLAFYKVDRPTEGRWAGYTFVAVLASDTEHPIKGDARIAILAKIAADPKAAMVRYGMEIGRCGHCGRTLTDEESRAAGIGPVCAKGLGW